MKRKLKVGDVVMVLPSDSPQANLSQGYIGVIGHTFKVERVPFIYLMHSIEFGKDYKKPVRNFYTRELFKIGKL